MGRCDKLLKKANQSPKGVRFAELCRLAECWGYEPKQRGQTSGSHQKYKHSVLRLPDPYAMFVFTNKQGFSPAYQVDQVLAAIAYIQDTFPDYEPT